MLADLPLASWVIDPDTLDLLEINDAALAQYGYSREEVASISLGDIWPGEGLAGALRALDEPGAVVRSSGPWRHQRKDGSSIDVLVSARRSAWNGRPSVVIVAVDVTAHRLEDARLKASEQRLRLLGQLAAGVAHDLNQSLALISGYGELAQQALSRPALDVTIIDEYLGIMRQAATHSGETVQRLLTFARGHEPERAQLIDVAVLLQEVAALTAPRWRDLPEAEGRPIRLELQAATSDDPMTIMGWPASLRDALTNLVFNAVDALPRGGTIRLSGRRRGDAVEIEVADDGVGMPPEVRARVFEPFFTTRGEHGTGLGLAQVLDIVRRHRWQVDVDSAPEAGTTCRLLIPSAGPDATSSPPAAPVTARPGRRLRVLIVEDVPALARLLAQMVGLRGHRVVTVSSAEAALERLEDFHIDLVISDLGLGPGMNGWELAGEVRARWPGLAFGLATGWAPTIDLADARERGVVGLLAKPFKAGDVLRFLEQIERSINTGLRSDVALVADHDVPADSQWSSTTTTLEYASAGSQPAAKRARPALSPRQREVLGLVARGMTNRAIAELVGVSGCTIKTHVEGILTKLRVADRTQAAVLATQLGLIHGWNGDIESSVL